MNAQSQSKDSLAHVKIVLVETSHPGNIGAAARAMKTMGLSHLCLVSPKLFPSSEATDRSSGAEEILEQAEVVDDFQEAIADCHRVIGASARLRQLSMETQTPRVVAEQAMQDFAKNDGRKIAIVFGRERSGLTNQEISRCHTLLHIPSNPDFWSLNLGSSVQVVAYEMRMAMLALGEKTTATSSEPQVGRRTDPVVPAEAATVEQVERFFDHLFETITRSGFLDPGNPRLLVPRLRNLFNRLQPDHEELQILRGMLKSFSRNAPELTAEQQQALEDVK